MALLFPLATRPARSHPIDKDAYRYTIDAAGQFAKLREGYESVRGYPTLQIEYMAIVVGGLMRMANLVGSMRGEVRLGQRGLAQFDADLSGFQARVRVYASQFDRGPTGEPQPFPVAGMSTEDWSDYRDTLEGPILYWDRKAWLGSSWWSNPLDGPPGVRPDGLEQWMLWNQVSAARETHHQLITTFWGYTQLRASELADAASGAAKEIWRGIAATAQDAAAGAWDAIQDNLVPSSTAGRIGAAIALGGLFAGGLYLWLRPGRA